MASDKPFHLTQNQSLTTAVVADELLHPKQNQAIKADSLTETQFYSVTETQFFSFSVPEAKIHAYCYIWHRPNLNLVTGGLIVWQGTRLSAASAELCDIHCYMHDSALKNDLHKYQLANGYGVEVLEPLKRHRLTYADKGRNNSVDIHFDAVSPPVMFGDGTHFEQALRARGELVLRGTRYKVDCYSVRDRSWAKARSEDNMSLPPYSWMSGVFSGDFSFNCGVFDQVSSNPELKGTQFEMPEERTLSGGWLYRDGQVSRITIAKKRIERDDLLHAPTTIHLELTDELGRHVNIHGTRVASCPWTPWTNLNFTIASIRWECEGKIAHGECQEPMWTDYCNKFFSS